jgi:hypothetical protein
MHEVQRAERSANNAKQTYRMKRQTYESVEVQKRACNAYRPDNVNAQQAIKRHSEERSGADTQYNAAIC